MPKQRDRSGGFPEGPERFRSAGSYQVTREWRRYEGTPQRELLLRVRERFLETALAGVSGDRQPRLEIGPGPGRFSPILARSRGRLVLMDLSRAMLSEALRTLDRRTSSSPSSISAIQADARWLPARRRAFSLVTALGNVVGFAGGDAQRLLREVADVVAPRGILVLETFSPISATPAAMARLPVSEWRGLLDASPSRALERVLADGFQIVRRDTGREGKTSEFRFLDGPTLKGALSRAGLTEVDRLVAAPLTGGDPRLVETISALGKGSAEGLQALEIVAGRDPRFLEHGGHLLTCWTRVGSNP